MPVPVPGAKWPAGQRCFRYCSIYGTGSGFVQDKCPTLTWSLENKRRNDDCTENPNLHGLLT